MTRCASSTPTTALWDLSVRDQDWITGDELALLRRDLLLDEYAALARSAGVRASVVVQTVTVPEETPELLARAANSTMIAGVVGWTDLTSPDVAEQIKALAAQPGGDRLVGMRHRVQSEPDAHWLTRPEASDWPVCTLAAEYADVIDVAFDLTAMLGPDERTAVFAKTATRVYGLGLLSLPRLAGSPSGMRFTMPGMSTTSPKEHPGRADRLGPAAGIPA